MGHYLDPLLDQVKDRYSTDMTSAYDSGWDEGTEYVENLIHDFWSFQPVGQGAILLELLDYMKTRPVR